MLDLEDSKKGSYFFILDVSDKKFSRWMVK